MKNRILGLLLVTVACVIVYVYAALVLSTKNLNAPDFIKGFAIGLGLMTGATVVVLLIKKAREKAKAA